MDSVFFAQCETKYITVESYGTKDNTKYFVKLKNKSVDTQSESTSTYKCPTTH